MKHFALYWNSGKTEYIEGNSITDAFMKAGYSGGALSALDYYKEVNEIPANKKEVLLQSKTVKKSFTEGILMPNIKVKETEK